MKYEAIAPAKINLGLRVLRRRKDGFHDIETVLLRIPWADRITITHKDTLTLTCTDPRIPTDETNLCLRAAHALQSTAGKSTGAHIHLEKHLPAGAGLGGGSSDAATTLRLLCHLWQVHLSERELGDLAADLGSDVPFFLGGPAALAQGRGEMLTEILGGSGSPYVLPFPIVIAVPRVAVSTSKAYSVVTPRPRHGGADRLVELVKSNDLERWRGELVNDFEQPILTLHPSIAAVKRMLLDAGARYASLSGSGSAVYGVFANDAGAKAAAQAGAQAGHRVWSGRAE